jgi:dTDP-glucose 4,6-dehydratase
MNILVTGGAGFIGSNLIRSLIGRPEVERLVNLDCLTYAGHLESLENFNNSPHYIFEKIDIRDNGSVRRIIREHKITHVIHLASETHVDRSINNPGDFIHTNIVGTFHLLEACRDIWSGMNENRCFLHVSTDEVFGSLGLTGCFTETSPYAPNSPYSASKASSDMLVRSYFHTYGLPVITTNCTNNYGPYQHPEKFIPLIIQKLMNREPVPIYGDGMNMRDWLHVTDHCEALWVALTQGRHGETYCIGGDCERANLDVAHLICKLIEKQSPELFCDSERLITFVPDRLGHDRRYAIDHSKITNELGWKPARDFEDGIHDTVQWYVNNQQWINCVLKTA